MPADHLEVHVDTRAGTVRVGDAYFTISGQRVATSFVYDTGFLADPTSSSIDPHLELVTGTQYNDRLPGVFQDSSPDRWGRSLIEKRIKAIERREGKTPRQITELDFLVGVSDITRQGALRFRSPGEAGFLGSHRDVPKLIDLPRLVNAADRLSRRSDDHDAIKTLLDAGSGSLGGARPKASVVDEGRLMIAKFGHAHDEWDVMAWECTALDIAQAAGVAVPAHRLVKVDGASVLLVDRFDRTDAGGRILYASAMTLVGARDGESHDVMDIAEAITDHGGSTSSDLEELFRRAVLSCAIRNTDDHLRNTGFLRYGNGWTLSPAFDINPNPDVGKSRVTTIGTASTPTDEPDGLALSAHACRISPPDARRIIAEVKSATARWVEIAARNGVSETERSRFADTFATGQSVIEAADRHFDRGGHPEAARRGQQQPRRPGGTPRGGQFASPRRSEADNEPG